MDVSELNLGDAITRVFEKDGIISFFPPQEDAIKAGLLEGNDLLVCTPTASGKTVMAELAALKAMRQGKQVLYLVPLRALAAEKAREFGKWEKLGFNVELEMGDLDSKFLSQKCAADLLVATAEKCDSILRSKPTWFRDLGAIIIDEIHLIGTNRGPTYEILIAKFKEMFPEAQIIGLSATVGNSEEMAEWLGAKLLKSTWRPTKLSQKIELGKFETLESETTKTKKDGAQSLVFVNSRRSAEAVAEKLSAKMGKTLDGTEQMALSALSSDIENVLSSPTAQCARLGRCVAGGVAFHHAGIVNGQRELVENAFKDGRIKVICATPTLAAGINLPARKVIIRDIKRYTDHGMDYIPVLEYMQMAGRAGRPRYDDEGECVLLAPDTKEAAYLQSTYLEGEPEAIHSMLGVEPILRTHVLSAIASGFCRSTDGLFEFFGRTFFAHQFGTGGEFKVKVERILRQLSDWGFVVMPCGKDSSIDSEGLFVTANDISACSKSEIIATPLGARVSELYLDPESAYVFKGIMEDKEGSARAKTISWLEMLCTSSELRPLLYVRKSEEDELWGKYYETEEIILTRNDSDYLERFKTALMFSDWLDERSEAWIMENYQVAPGLLRIKLNTAEWLAYCCAEIAPLTKARPSLRREFQTLQMRIKHGVKEELAPLIAIKGIGRVRGRKLFSSGFKSKSDLSKTNVEELEGIVGKKTAENILRQVR